MTNACPRSEVDIVLSGLRHRIQMWGDGSGTPTLLLHGWLDQGKSFEDFAQTLVAAGHPQVWALDFRGHGASEWIGPGGYYHFIDYVRDIEQLYHQRPELHGGVLIGHSMGGAVACYFAGTYPELVGRLVMMEGHGPAGRQPEDMPARTREWIGDLRRFAKPRYYQTTEGMLLRTADIYPTLSPEMVEKFVRSRLVQEPQGYRWNFDPLHMTTSPMPFLSSVFLAFAQQVRAPTLAMTGDESFMSGEEDADVQRRYAAFGERLSRRTIAGAGHMMHLSHGVVAAQLVIQWLADCEQASNTKQP